MRCIIVTGQAITRLGNTFASRPEKAAWGRKTFEDRYIGEVKFVLNLHRAPEEDCRSGTLVLQQLRHVLTLDLLLKKHGVPD